MPNLNRVFLMGYLTRDPAQRFLPNGQGVVDFGMATNRKFNVNGEKREEATFVDITAWGKQGELIHQHLRKGSPIFLEGRLKFDQWEKDGVKRSKLSVVLDRFEFLGDGGKRGGADDSAAADFGPDKHANEDVPF